MKIEDDDYQYSLEAMLAHALKVNGGKPITEKRRKEVEKLDQQFRATKEAYQNAVARCEAQARNEERLKVEAEVEKLRRELHLLNDPESSFNRGMNCLALKTDDGAFEARKWFGIAAEEGSPSAQYQLAKLHETAEGGPLDVKEACRLYSLASAQNHGPSQNNLGIIFEMGILVEKDEQFALHMYRMGKESGDPDAAHNLERLDQKLSEDACDVAIAKIVAKVEKEQSHPGPWGRFKRWFTK